jgi:hypothetical protein
MMERRVNVQTMETLRLVIAHHIDCSTVRVQNKTSAVPTSID